MRSLRYGFSALLDWCRILRFQDGPGPFLGNDIGWGIGVPGGDSREDRRIDYPQTLYSMDFQVYVDHRQRIAAHLAGAHRVEDGGAELPGGFFEILICFG